MVMCELDLCGSGMDRQRVVKLPISINGEKLLGKWGSIVVKESLCYFEWLRDLGSRCAIEIERIK
jgi:hypothetical protein